MGTVVVSPTVPLCCPLVRGSEVFHSFYPRPAFVIKFIQVFKGAVNRVAWQLRFLHIAGFQFTSATFFVFAKWYQQIQSWVGKHIYWRQMLCTIQVQEIHCVKKEKRKEKNWTIDVAVVTWCSPDLIKNGFDTYMKTNYKVKCQLHMVTILYINIWKGQTALLKDISSLKIRFYIEMQ